jgi:hypothetical protein
VRFGARSCTPSRRSQARGPRSRRL